MKIYIRVDSYTELTTIDYFDYITALSAIGGLAAGVYKPLLIFLSYFTNLNFIAKIISELYSIRQTKDEFF
jgi:hypothetical protein